MTIQASEEIDIVLPKVTIDIVHKGRRATRCWPALSVLTQPRHVLAGDAWQSVGAEESRVGLADVTIKMVICAEPPS